MTSNYDFLFELKGSCNLQWQTQKCDADSILFYSIPSQTSESIEVFKKRLKDLNFKYCIVNLNNKFIGDKVISISDKDFKSLQVSLLQAFYPFKSSLKFLGVTGTNGKTTTVDLIRQIALQNNKNIMTFGTLGVFKNEKVVENFNLTTPSIVDIYKTIHTHQQEVEMIAFELSSHALHQDRLGGISFDAIGWTNFTQDHLDYHQSMDEYFASKCLIRKKIKKNGQIFLTNDLLEYADRISFAYQVIANVDCGNAPFFQMQYNQTNMALAHTLISSVENLIKFNSEEILPPAGRFEILSYGESFIIVDYAHTPDALESIGGQVAQTFKDHKVIFLFGCGGDRDKTKRVFMGKAASRFACEVIITNDNPRSEDPSVIAEDVVQGVSIPFEIELDRKKAIALGVSKLKKHVLIIAGKGHENYMEIAGVKNYFSDIETVREILND